MIRQYRIEWYRKKNYLEKKTEKKGPGKMNPNVYIYTCVNKKLLKMISMKNTIIIINKKNLVGFKYPVVSHKIKQKLNVACSG